MNISIETKQDSQVKYSPFQQFANKYLLEVIGTSVVVSLVLLIVAIANSWTTYRGLKDKVNQQLVMQDLSGKIVHLDEVLTMSARMGAATGDKKWEQRYKEFEQPLIDAITKVIELSPNSYKEYGQQTDQANLKLVEMEKKAFDLVSKGQNKIALNLLLGQEYEQQKKIYATGIGKTLENIKQETEKQVQDYSNRLFVSLIFAVISLSISAITWIAIVLIIKEYIRQRDKNQKALIKTQDELLKLNEELERRGTELVLKEKLAQEQTETLQTEIGELLEVVSSIEQGDLTVQAKVGEGLTGIFADTLNRLLEGLSSVMNAVLRTTLEVTYTASELQDLAISTTIQAQEQANSVAEVEALTQYVTDLSQVNLEQAIAANKVVQQTQAAVLLGQQEMSDMTAGIVSLGEGSEQIVRRLGALQEFVELATQFSKEQKRVATLTKVLAFNASMTASRALEQQDPEQFATVAREFETIASQINELAAQTNDGLIVLQQRSDQIQTAVSGISENLKEINRLVKDFRTNVSHSNQVFDNIKLVTEQLTQVEQEINQSSKSIATAAQTTLKAISAIATTARTTESKAEITRQQSEMMGELAEKLLQMVKFFRVSENAEKNQEMLQGQAESKLMSDR